MSIRETVSNAHSHWMDSSGPDSDIVISSRVRVARNLNKLPFPHILSEQDAQHVINSLREAIKNKNGSTDEREKLELTQLSELTPVERQILVEKHLISPDLLENYQKKAVILDDSETISIMVNEEDHLRLQCLLPGQQLNEAWNVINRVDDRLEESLEYAYDENLGYLTACPTNVGTGLRASVMLHLPCLVLFNRIKDVLSSVSKLGLTVRGMYGEGTDATANFYQISNQVTLGQTEEDIIDALISVAGQILSSERVAREALIKERKDHIEDRVCRAYGLLSHAHIIDTEESMRLLSDLRLGVSLNIIKNIPLNMITEIMVMIRPAMLIKMAGQDLSPLARDIYRADLIREKMRKNNTAL